MTNFRTIAIGIGSTLLGLTLIGLGLVELVNPAMLGAFATWGYPERFRVLLAIAEISGGLLFLLPRVAWYSAAILGILLAGAISTHLWNGQAQQLVPATVLLAGVVVVGYTRHPRAFALTRLRAVADAVAEREIAQARQREANKGTVARSSKGPSFFSAGRPATEPKATSATTRPAGRAAAATNFASRNSGV
jgi:uncharacterized membrane protein YphA (DoxX/SURF4 family)